MTRDNRGHALNTVLEAEKTVTVRNRSGDSDELKELDSYTPKYDISYVEHHLQRLILSKNEFNQNQPTTRKKQLLLYLEVMMYQDMNKGTLPLTSESAVLQAFTCNNNIFPL